MSAQDLADRIAAVCDGACLGDQGTALSLNLAAVIAGYAPADRGAATTAFHSLMSQRVDQLVRAGLDHR